MIVIRDLIGKPYRTHGRGPDSYDCYGLAIEVCRRFGRLLEDALYEDTKAETEERVIDEKKASLSAEKISCPVEGAIVEFLVCGKPRHIGVCLGDGNFIHCGKYGVRVETLSSWSKRIEGYYIWQS